MSVQDPERGLPTSALGTIFFNRSPLDRQKLADNRLMQPQQWAPNCKTALGKETLMRITRDWVDP